MRLIAFELHVWPYEFNALAAGRVPDFTTKNTEKIHTEDLSLIAFALRAVYVECIGCRRD